jgi:sugar transferase (PEP-CTERM/EpsH1 system associated)
MQLLYFATHQAWPINTGARVRDYHLARHLAARCSVTFAEMTRAGEERCKPPEHSRLASIVTLHKSHSYTPYKVLMGLTGPKPLTVLNCWSRRMASELAAALRFRKFDCVQVEGVHLMEYLPVIQGVLSSPPIVLDWHNIESELMRRYAEISVSPIKRLVAKRTAKLIERAEDHLLDACSTHTVTSERERQKLVARWPGANIQVIPNGVDTGAYSLNEIAQASRRTGQGNSKQSILFVGSMDYHANIDAVMWFSRTAWPEISRKHPNVHFMIVGRDPVPEVRALASDRVHVTGTVDDVRPFYATALAAVVPIRSASGTRLKILEAMAAGVPVVSTRFGAEGIEAEDNIHILLADTGQEVVGAVDRIISSPETRKALSAAARALVITHYDWSIIGEQLYRIHCELLQERQHSLFQNVS